MALFELMGDYVIKATGGRGSQFFYHFPKVDATITITETNVTTSSKATVTAPAGTYYPGQTIPIQVDLGYPVEITKNIKLTVNGETLTPLEAEKAGRVGEVCTFAYTVPEIGVSTLTLNNVQLGAGNNLRGDNRRDISMALSGDGVQQGAAFPEITLSTPETRDFFTGLTLGVTLDENKKPQLNARLGLRMDEEYKQPIIRIYSERLAGSAGDGRYGGSGDNVHLPAGQQRCTHSPDHHHSPAL